MHAMQYKITLPNDYDMAIIRQRVSKNGSKTDHFPDLFLKAYLIIDTPLKKEYAPLYFWKEHAGMNQFIFEGFYDNILASFGWQQIAIGVPLHLELSENFTQASYVLEIEHCIQATEQMTAPVFSLQPELSLGKALIYNPDKWAYAEFYFFEQIPKELVETGTVYELLHLSQ
ncbi:DUF4865 family protein [Enterococcus wangshanyuanii]|uniref:DUF4865 domain-containing protein n=1 Tax=Enterococcus wangshanyuanii TaxID=2005703 RepID=A0ABQ1P7S0_9ENTE|nr:DUF4865 family protein [Enterococcus wangshanyuanii]GGC92372.1 DUF4865 domain-containing protein [Enterococcus wangshanyuanii]